MSSDETAIANLLYRYAELIDAGNLSDAADLFRHARIFTGVSEVDAEGLLEVWQEIVIHKGGTPRTSHVITNPIIEVDGDRAICRSKYTVFQATDTLPLQPIAAGRYHDTFEKVDGSWRYTHRDYSFLDLIGDLTQHVPAHAKPTTEDSH